MTTGGGGGGAGVLPRSRLGPVYNRWPVLCLCVTYFVLLEVMPASREGAEHRRRVDHSLLLTPSTTTTGAELLSEVLAGGGGGHGRGCVEMARAALCTPGVSTGCVQSTTFRSSNTCLAAGPMVWNGPAEHTDVGERAGGAPLPAADDAPCVPAPRHQRRHRPPTPGTGPAPRLWATAAARASRAEAGADGAPPFAGLAADGGARLGGCGPVPRRVQGPGGRGVLWGPARGRDAQRGLGLPGPPLPPGFAACVPHESCTFGHLALKRSMRVVDMNSLMRWCGAVMGLGLRYRATATRRSLKDWALSSPSVWPPPPREADACA